MCEQIQTRRCQKSSSKQKSGDPSAAMGLARPDVVWGTMKDDLQEAGCGVVYHMGHTDAQGEHRDLHWVDKWMYILGWLYILSWKQKTQQNCKRVLGCNGILSYYQMKQRVWESRWDGAGQFVSTSGNACFWEWLDEADQFVPWEDMGSDPFWNRPDEAVWNRSDEADVKPLNRGRF